MTRDQRAGVNDQISSEAAEWLVEFRSGDVDAAGRRDFDAWLRASPEHIRAFIEMAALWHESGAIDPRRQLDVEAIIARAQSEQAISGLSPATASGATVSVLPMSGAPLGSAIPLARGRLARWPIPSAGWAAAASVLVAALAVVLIFHSSLLGPPTYSTGVRARRSIVLPDGSSVLLDSRSRLRVSFTPAARTVNLLQGQALFHVIKNPRQPFLVHVGDMVVRDVGTVFDVNRIGDGTIVTVVEGRVAVGRLPDQAAPRPIDISAGEQLNVILGNLHPLPMRVDVSSATAWTNGKVVLESATLTEVAQVFNRYSTRKLVAKDEGRKPLRLSGVFSTNPTFLIQYLRQRSDIVVTETDSEIDIARDPAK